MVEVDASVKLTGPNGPVTLLEVFEGRRQLYVYFQMWHAGMPAEQRCEGCTLFNGQVRELAYLHARDVTYATFCEGPYDESVRIATSWDGNCRRTPHGVPPRFSLLDAGSGCKCRTSATATACRWPRKFLWPRAPRVRDLLDLRARCRSHGAELWDSRHDRVRQTGDMGRLAGRLASALCNER